jgi:hypothetical protein
LHYFFGDQTIKFNYGHKSDFLGKVFSDSQKMDKNKCPKNEIPKNFAQKIEKVGPYM